MTHQPFFSKEKIGTITLEHFGGSIRLRWRHQGKRYSLTVGKDSKQCLKAARAKAQLIDSDILFDKFDPNLAKYGKNLSSVTLNLVSDTTLIPLRELWDEFLEDKLLHCKAKTIHEYQGFTKILDKLSDHLAYNGLSVKQALLKVTTPYRTQKILVRLNACCKWGIKHGLCNENPFEGMANEMNISIGKSKNQADAFTRDEVDLILKSFAQSEYYSHYTSLVQFWFITGCRPSEAIGLQWGHISEDCSKIHFCGSIQNIGGKLAWSEGSKNNKIRTFPCSEKLRNLLLLIKPVETKSDTPVFPNLSGKFIRYPDFRRRAWKTIVDPIKPNTTPYNCRDTFITNQLLSGISANIIALWCDTSVGMIEQNYADKLKLSAIRPID